MSIPAELSQLATNLAGIVTPQGYTAIRRIYTGPPTQAPTTADLPCLIIFYKAPPRLGVHTFGNESREMVYLVDFLYSPVGAGDLNADWQAMNNYVEPVLNALWLHTALQGNVNWAVPQQDTTPAVLQEKWGGDGYRGIEFSIRCLATRTLTIGD